MNTQMSAGWIWQHIQNLYRIDSQLGEKHMDPALPAAALASQSRLIARVKKDTCSPGSSGILVWQGLQGQQARLLFACRMLRKWVTHWS
jgi:hypothetical protein